MAPACRRTSAAITITTRRGRLDQVGLPGPGLEVHYDYDAYGELIGVPTRSGCSGVVADTVRGALFNLCSVPTGGTSYAYDHVGNRTDLGATYGAGNRLAQFHGGFYTYDADGNVTEKSGVEPTPHTQRFYWNAESRLDSLTYDGAVSIRYAYNALGQPVQKSRNGVLERVWLWAGAQLLAELEASNQRIADYQYTGTDQPYAVTLGSTTATAVQYPEQDALGNVIGTQDGVTRQTIRYDPWGVPSDSGDGHNRLRWKGLLYEGGPAQGDVVGLYYMRGRWYDPQAGRFIQEDPIHAGVNDYTFAGDDPINGFDPSGLCSQSQIIAVQDDNGNTVPGCSDGSAPTFNSRAPLAPVVTSAQGPNRAGPSYGNPLPSVTGGGLGAGGGGGGSGSGPATRADHRFVRRLKNWGRCGRYALWNNRHGIALDIAGFAITAGFPEGSAAVAVAGSTLGLVGIGVAVVDHRSRADGVLSGTLAYTGKEAALAEGALRGTASAIGHRFGWYALLMSTTYDASKVVYDFHSCPTGN